MTYTQGKGKKIVAVREICEFNLKESVIIRFFRKTRIKDAILCNLCENL